MTADMAELANEIEDLRERFPKLKDDDLFVLWFLTAYVADDPDAVVDALGGGAGDKSVDAVLIDHDADRVAIVQGKYSTTGKTPESRSDVMAFADLADVVMDTAPRSRSPGPRRPSRRRACALGRPADPNDLVTRAALRGSVVS